MNKKKVLISLSMVGMLSFGAVFGTMARYQFNAQSTGNTITAAKFAPYTNLSESRTITIDNARPGMEEQYHSFIVNKGDTEVPIKYTVSVESDGQLFTTENSPVKAILQVYNEANDLWEDINGNTITKDEAEGDEIANNHYYKYRVRVNWPLDTTLEDGTTFNDKILSGKKGAIKINLHSEQTDMSKVSTYHNFVNVKTYVKHKPSGHYYYNSDNKEVLEYYKTEDGKRVMVLHDVNVIDKSNANSEVVLDTITFKETGVKSGSYRVDGLPATNNEILEGNTIKLYGAAGGQYELRDMPQALVEWLK